MTATRILLLVGCYFCASCGPTAERSASISDQAVVDTLASLAGQFSAAYIAGDARAMTAIYTDDAVLFPNNSEFIRGRDAIERYWTLPEGRRITRHKLIPVEVEVSGSMASDFGHYEIAGENDGVAWGPANGKYMVVWKRGEDGRWRMYLDMWNSRPQPSE